VLSLASPTQDAWFDLVMTDVDTLLVDHAHCEKKAASMAIQLLFRCVDQQAMLPPLSALAREELRHFELMLSVLNERNIPMRKLHPAPYAGKLRQVVRVGEPENLIDTLICCALVEARSCERMQILAERLPDPQLRALYADLLESEARHHGSYLELARLHAPAATITQRVSEIADHEATVLTSLHNFVRVHA
jgi:tRNA-(ms[2]io[6]A)-hydroxylase